MANQPQAPPDPSRPHQQSTSPAEINAATRRQHVELNRLIVDRDPALLGQGLVAFARLFFAFEAVWEELISGSNGSVDMGGIDKARRNEWLANLRPQGLPRTERLKNDLHYISQRSKVSLPSISAKQQKTVNVMCDSIRAQPHTLVAYAWVMYMAIFSGGRWIRQCRQ